MKIFLIALIAVSVYGQYHYVQTICANGEHYEVTFENNNTIAKCVPNEKR